MPINSPGTLAFAPNGFQFSRSLSSTNPMINGVETFTWDPRFHGFSGDLAVNSLIVAKPATGMSLYSWIYTPAVTTPGAQQGARSCVYPCPLMQNDPAYPSQVAVTDQPIGVQTVGVIVQFRYCPANGNGVDQVSVQNFNNTTALFPNTVVEVDVLTDPHAVYRAQVYAPWGYSNVLCTNSYMIVGALSTYTLSLPATSPLGVTAAPVNQPFTFPLGVFSGTEPGSRAYAYVSTGLVQAATTNSWTAVSSSATMLSINNVCPTGDPTSSPVSGQYGSVQTLRSIGLSKGIDGNNYTTSTGTVYPHVYVDVTLVNQGFGKPPLYIPYTAV